ncbi:MAG: methyltransferase domain-containing protein [Rhodobacteraceae bacterium]|nr:methyltransferase domain-containing protein [Paracoccaceae bacterium]
MTRLPNEIEAAAWNAERGQEWVRRQATLDALMAEVLDLLLDAADLKPGEAILDIGCGAGATTLAAAQRLGAGGSVLGVDLSVPLLDHAVARAEALGLETIDFHLADAQTHPFKVARFDRMISRFGVMFFDDPTTAFRNISRALRPGARLVFAAWSRPDLNPWFAIPARVATSVLGPLEAPDLAAPGPMAFHDIERVVGILRAAGLADCSGAARQIVLTPPGSFDEVVEFVVSVGPASRVIAARGGTEADRAAILEGCRAELEDFHIDGRVLVPASVNLFQARRPG